MTQPEVVYWGTGLMLIIAILFILMIVWINNKLVSQHKLISRNMERIEGIELLIRTEFKEVLDQLKKI